MIGMMTSPEDIAREQLRQYQAEQGMVFEDPDAPVSGFRKEGDQLVPYEPDDKDEELGGGVLNG